MSIHKPVSEIMTTAVVSVSPSQKLIDVKHIFERKQFHHHIPVTENGLLVGMISMVDFMRNIQGSSIDDNESVYHKLCAKDIMSAHPKSISPDTTVKAAAEMLAKGEVHALVVAKEGKLLGIVSTADIIHHLLSQAS